MIHKLPYETLLQIYNDSIKYALDQDFIELLEHELKRRETAKTIGETPDAVGGRTRFRSDN